MPIRTEKAILGVGSFLLIVSMILSNICIMSVSAKQTKKVGIHTMLRKAEEKREILDSTGNYLYVVNEDGTATLEEYLGNATILDIPTTLDGHTVTVIGKGAFGNKTLLSTVIIPPTILRIEYKAFLNTGLESIKIPESVTYIGDYAFSSCFKFKSFYIPKNVIEIGINPFVSCSYLTKIEVDRDNPNYQSVDGVLYNRDMTEIISVPKGIDITEYTLTNSVLRIGDYAFSGSKLTEIVIPDRVTDLGRNAFSSCFSLEKIKIGKGITEISASAFSGCDSLEKVSLSKDGNLEKICFASFSDCYALKKIDIPDSVKVIEKMAFYNTNIKKITLPKSIVTIENMALGCGEDGQPEIHIKGYSGTVAKEYAKEKQVTFEDIETGEVIHYELTRIATEKIKKLTAGRKQITVTYKKLIISAEYQIAVRRKGSDSWKTYASKKSEKVITGLKSGKEYQVRVRARRNVDGMWYYGKWSEIKKIRVR